MHYIAFSLREGMKGSFHWETVRITNCDYLSILLLFCYFSCFPFLLAACYFLCHFLCYSVTCNTGYINANSDQWKTDFSLQYIYIHKTFIIPYNIFLLTTLLLAKWTLTLILSGCFDVVFRSFSFGNSS